MPKFILVIIFLAPTLLNASILTDLQNRNFHIKWKEKNNFIITSTVCYDFKKGSLESRFCQKQAVVKFKQKCRKLPKGAQQEKFCIASRMNPLG